MSEQYSYVNTVHFLKTVSSKVIFNAVIFLFYPNYGHKEYTDIQNILKKKKKKTKRNKSVLRFYYTKCMGI